MIQLPIATAFMVYLGLTLGVLLVLWVYNNFSQKNRSLIPYQKRLHKCEYCQSPYLEENFKNVTRCPQCQSFNKSPKAS